MAGLHGGARTAGWALQALPDGLRIGGQPVPWHRVINAHGHVSPRHDGPRGETSIRQMIRLRREGIKVSIAGEVDLGQLQWEGRPARPTRRGVRARPRS